MKRRSSTWSQIARVYGVPPEMIVGEAGNSLTYANVEQRSLDFLTYAINPWLVRLDHALGRLLPSTLTVKLNADALLRSTTLERYQAHKVALDAGFMTIDEVRAVGGPAADAASANAAAAVRHVRQRRIEGRAADHGAGAVVGDVDVSGLENAIREYAVAEDGMRRRRVSCRWRRASLRSRRASWQARSTTTACPTLAPARPATVTVDAPYAIYVEGGRGGESGLLASVIGGDVVIVESVGPAEAQPFFGPTVDAWDSIIGGCG